MRAQGLDASEVRGLAVGGVGQILSTREQGVRAGLPGAKFWCRSPGGLSEELLSKSRARRSGPPVEMGARGERGGSQSEIL